jgi:hypothetical protein
LVAVGDDACVLRKTDDADSAGTPPDEEVPQLVCLGAYRCVVERTLSCGHGFRNLCSATEITRDMQYAFLNIALSLICHRFLDQSCCQWHRRYRVGV